MLLLVSLLALAAPDRGGFDATPDDAARWSREAKDVSITRDDWGIAHVYGKTDADAVFGMIYAQAEDDFNRVETNYLIALGRQAEAGDDGKMWTDLRARLFNDPEILKRQFAESPRWLQKLMRAWADGLNFYLATHPKTKPKLIRHFEAWMPLAFSEGSIGGDTERVNPRGLEEVYGRQTVSGAGPAAGAALNRNAVGESEQEPGGSNGIAIGPSDTKDHHALLLINPHTSFFFRSEIQVRSGEGLDAYGAVTWGQFFIYQGFNDRCGWMHTSSGVDAVDEYIEQPALPGPFQTHIGPLAYQYGKQFLAYGHKDITIKLGGGRTRTFDALYSRHGPVVRFLKGQPVTIQLMQKPIEALEQSFLRTKARNYREFRRTMDLRADSSNNTIFADADGDIAYFHGNFIPRRDTRFDFTKPVDGSDPATDWHGLLAVDETPHLLNPASGYLFNVNNWPWAGAGKSSLKKADYPAYVEKGGESARGLHAIRVLEGKTDFTLDSLQAAAFDSYLPWFEKPLAALRRTWGERLMARDAVGDLAAAVELLKNWDLRWRADSVETSLAVFWGEQLQLRLGAEARREGLSIEDYAGTRATPSDLSDSLAAAMKRLTQDFGTWKTPWGDINRFQRITADIEQPFTDGGASIPVPFTSSVWGSLASFGARPYPGTKKWYGTSGNSFVAVVEFGKRVHARAVTAGGESGHPDSKHFDDEAGRYASGNLREVYFYPDQLAGHTERKYRPGG